MSLTSSTISHAALQMIAAVVGGVLFVLLSLSLVGLIISPILPIILLVIGILLLVGLLILG
jgi:hypothetical protein